jgi:hypothetical protein
MAFLVVSQCEWKAFAQTFATSTGAAAVGGFTVTAQQPRSDGPLLFGARHFTVPGAETREQTGTTRSILKAAVDTAVANGAARPKVLASRAQGGSSSGKSRALMWTLIAAGAGGAVLAVALLKSDKPEEDLTITAGTPTVGGPQ